MTARKMIDVARQLEVPPTLTLRNGVTVTGEIIAAGDGGVQLAPYEIDRTPVAGAGKRSNDTMINWDDIAACALPAVKLEF
jgi:hypothetical protein